MDNSYVLWYNEIVHQSRSNRKKSSMNFVEHLGQPVNLSVLAALALMAAMAYGVHSGDFAEWLRGLRG